MNLPATLPISSKKAVIATAILIFIAFNYEDLLFFATDFVPAAPVAIEEVAAPRSGHEPPRVTRSLIERLKGSAESGNVNDQLALATKYSTGNGVVKDQAEASRWYLLAARGGNVPAMYEVSVRFRNGYGFAQNDAESDVWRQRAASGGHPEAAHAMAHSYGTVTSKGAFLSEDKSKDPSDSSRQLVAWLTRASELGSMAAKHELAVVRLFGISKGGTGRTGYLIPLPSVTASAIQLLTENAEAGHWPSQYALAELYEAGYADIKPNPPESNKWWQRMGTQTDASVQVAIGRRYFVSNANEYRAGDNRWNGKGLSYEETSRVAFEWFSRAAAQANQDALWQLAVMEYGGVGTSKNPTGAVQLYQKAAELGQVNAMYYLGMAYLSGNGVQKDYASALLWLNRTVAYEDAYGSNVLRPSAQNAIGALHEHGDGVSNDLLVAYAWYSLASGAGSEEGKTNAIRVARLLKPEQLLEVQSLLRDWKPGKQISRRTS